MATAKASYPRSTRRRSGFESWTRPRASWPGRLLRSPQGVTGTTLLALLATAALVAPAVVPFDPIHVETGQALYSPGMPYLFGTDQYGRDVFSRVLAGTRLALLIGPLTVAIGLVPGVSIGLLGATTVDGQTRH